MAGARRTARDESPLTVRPAHRTVHAVHPMAEWKFARRRDRCSVCENVLEEDARHVSSLSVRGEDLAREDVCLPCWERRGPGDEIFFWYTRRRRGRGGLRLDLATLEQLFLRLEGHEGGKMLELRYVLCLLLMRKKRLKLARIVRDPHETLIVRRPRREESLRVAVCDFGPERMDELRRELTQIFDGAEGVPPDGEKDSASEGDPTGSGGSAEEVPPVVEAGA
jgi:hypothetical protein